MRLEIDIAEHHYNNIMALDSVSLGRMSYKGIIMYAINAIKQGKVLEQEPTTKNDLGVDCISREQAKVAIRDKFKDLPSRVEINTILNELPSVTPQLSSELEKNSQKLEKDFGELDCISRADAIRVASGYCHPSNVAKELAKLPSMGRYDPYTDKFIKE